MKRVWTTISLLATVICCLCGCQNDNFKTGTLIPEPYPRDFMCGYFLTFSDKNDENFVSPSSDDFLSDNAVAKYAGIEYAENSCYLYVKEGLPVTCEQMILQGDPLTLNKNGSISISDTIYFTAELIGKTVNIHGIYYSAERRELYSRLDTSAELSNSASIVHTLSDEMYGEVLNCDGQIETVKYSFYCSLVIECCDKITDVIITEIGSEHNLLKTTEIDTVKSLEKDTEEYVVTEENCSEVQLWMKFIVQQYYEGFGNYDFGTIYDASWIIKDTPDEESLWDYFYFPYGNGLTKPVKLKITFPE